MKVPQTLISTTWSLEEPSAAGLIESVTMPSDANDHVSVFLYNEKYGHVATESRHSLPILAMLWRPYGG